MLADHVWGSGFDPQYVSKAIINPHRQNWLMADKSRGREGKQKRTRGLPNSWPMDREFLRQRRKRLDRDGGHITQKLGKCQETKNN